MKLPFSIISIIIILSFSTHELHAQDSPKYSPDHYKLNPDLKTELNFVYIGASWCSPCLKDSLKQSLEDLKILLYERAQKENMNFSVIGVANDQSIQKGWDFLKSNGHFDEVIIGKKWINSGSIEFILNFEEVLPGIPQIVIFKRSLVYKEGLDVGENKIVARKIGEEAIRNWLENGAPFANN